MRFCLQTWFLIIPMEFFISPSTLDQYYALVKENDDALNMFGCVAFGG